MKETLFILSLFLFASCSSNKGSRNAQDFDVIKHLDSVFRLAHNWSESKPPIPNRLLDSLDIHMDSVKIYHFNNDIEPRSILFTAPKKSHLEILEQTLTIKNLNKVSYQSYEVWRSVIEGKEILEFSIQPHPVEKWIFSIRKRSQE